jgi:hypothetical protein
MANFPDLYPMLFGSELDISDLDALFKEYNSLRENAPCRTSHEKKYFVDGHDGIPSSSGSTNRREEHIAIALCNYKKNWENPRGGSFRFLDYQFPLKAQQVDKGIGKIDIIGVNDEGRLILTELKVDSKGGKSKDTFFSALLQGLRYAAIVEANKKAITNEARNYFHVEVKQLPPIVQLLATRKWWLQQFSNDIISSKLQQQFPSLMDHIKKKIGISVECLDFSDSILIFGKDGKKPKLEPKPKFRAVVL